MTLSMAEAVAKLTAPGMPFEMDEAVIGGVRLRVWKNAPPNLRALFEASAGHGDLPFVVYEDERMSYAEHHRLARRIAHALTHRFGISKGDRVAIAMRNLPEWPAAFWAIVSIGAIAVPLNAWWLGGELAFALEDSGTRVLIADGERAARMAEHGPVPGLEKLVVARGSVPGGAISWADFLAEAPDDPALPDVAIAPEDDATIFYTSGTTGKPKGALGSQRNMITNVYNIMFSACRGDLRRGVTPALLTGEPAPKAATLLSVPFFHATGCHSILLGAIVGGSKLVLMHRWDPERALELIERERVTQFGGVPAMVWQVLESPNFAKHDLASVVSVGYGGAPAASELAGRIKAAFPQAVSSNGYGLTETSSMATSNNSVDYLAKPDSIGVPLPVCEAKIVDPVGQELPRGQIGEIWLKGPNVVKGYWQRPEANAATFTEGWLHTGDLGRMDEEGFLYVVDRAKDMLIRGGENVYCVEVEDALYSHPAVMDAAVVGIPHRVLGEEVGAVVQLKPGTAASEAELRGHVGKLLAAFKVPVRIDIQREPLPRNANGKIMKRDLRARFAPSDAR